MANPLTTIVRELESIAANLRKPKVYPVENDRVGPYGFIYEDPYVPFGWDLQPEPIPMDRTCTGWEREL